MDDAGPATLYENWVQSIRKLSLDQQAAFDYREMRASIAAAIATVILRAAIGKSLNPNNGGSNVNRVVYGVWLVGHHANSPVYIGQTNDSVRRLWDLPIGESHHLANTFPPEIWSHVVVVRWLDLLQVSGEDLGVWASDFDSIGLALEYALQREYAPLMNVWRKNRDGTLVPVRLANSRSAGSVVAASKEFQGFFRRFLAVWTELRNRDAGNAEWDAGDYGGVAFPSRIYSRVVSERVYGRN